MKRGGYLKRYTPLKAGKKLARKAWLRTTEWKPKRPKVSRKEREARRLVYARSGGACENCDQARAADWHHRKARSQGGEWSADNGLHLCHQCHSDATSPSGERYEYAKDTGLIVLSHEDPFEVPVNTPAFGRRYRGPVQLSPCGGVWPVDLSEIAVEER